MEDKQDKSFWGDLGTNIAKGAKATQKGTVFGLVWSAKKVTNATSATGKAFANEWRNQK